ncbi:multidrug resistance-associated protein 9 isoform X2 [Cephus cinctus]|uniref:Multidrug resistance-associated protein 9 isoform X2 n=1 Tax=Cephus cinctus TaxID=211228 RepID=A0AAJ7FC90_CEPCN|nr:multidrug resistance-associated protein 9 isoform X2 [Cephus cinctus]
MSSSPEHSYNRFDGTDSIATSVDNTSINRPFPRNAYETKRSSTYVPHNRLSRYATALTNLIPVRFNSVPGSGLPLDKIGLFSSVSFSWLNEYLSAGCKNGMTEKPLPTIAPQDSCTTNGPRLEGLWHAHVVERGQAGASVPRIAWKFVRTRVLVASFVYLLGMLMSLMSPVRHSFIKLTKWRYMAFLLCFLTHFQIFILRKIILSIEERNIMSNNTMVNMTKPSENTTAIGIGNNRTAVNLVTEKMSLITTTTLAPLVSKLGNTSLNDEAKSWFGKDNVKKLPETITHIIMVDEVIVFSHVGILIFAEVVSYFLIAWSASMNLRTASRLRSACLALMYKKLIRSSVRFQASAHQTITYFVPDGETLYELITNGPMIITGPFLLILTSMLLWFLIGHWGLIGIAALIVLYLCLILTAYLTKVFATKAIEYSLKRLCLMEEFLGKIYLAKITLWDEYFKSKIEDTRCDELADIRRGGLSEGWSLCMVHIIPIITVCTMTMAILLTHKHIVSTHYIPVLVLLLINLKHCIRNSWLSMSSISRGVTSLHKLKTILTLKDTERYPDKPIDRSLAVTINHGNFTWVKDKSLTEKAIKRSSQFYVENHEGIPVRFQVLTPTDTLTDINFYAPKGKLIGICGQPGSGKTSLLLSLMGHLHHISGHVAMDGSCAYVPELPWLLEGTLKENILFGEIFNSNRYYRAIHSCLLHNDMNCLPESDDTDLAFVKMRPAQKQRIALARAVYVHREINLLDNPLADVDINESKDIFEKCIMHAMGSKTVIMVTDKIQFLNRCDIIYVMREGRIVEQGTHEELLQWNSEYTQLINFCMKKYQRKYYREGEQISTSSTQLLMAAVPRGVLTSISTNASLDSVLDDIDDSDLLQHEHDTDFPIKYCKENGKPLIQYGIYVKYANGYCLNIFICLLAIFYTFLIAVAPLCFTYVAQKTIKDNIHIIITFAVMLGSCLVFGLILMGIYNKTVFNVAKKVHDRWMDTICKAHISLFTTTPMTILLNIYTLYLQQVDSALPRSIITILIHIGISAFSASILGLISPWLLIPIAIFVLITIFYSIYVRGAILTLYKAKVSSTVPMFNHSVNTINGRSVIQAYHKERDFTKKFYRYCDNNSAFDFMLYSVKLWIEYRIKMISGLTLGVIIFMCASLTTIRDRFELMGLAFICTLQFAMSVIYLTGTTTRAYFSFMALNGIDNYIENIIKEQPGTARLPNNWPVESNIKFDNVLLPNGLEADANQEPINFTIASGEKVGIITTLDCGESLVSALYKFTDVPTGKIYIGNTNIADVPLEKLRQCISYIPSNPHLFDGSIRHNLDPTGKVTDKILMTVLQRVFLWEKVSKLSDKLETDARHIFTTGEKKLMFLARAILKKTSKIIIMEESTTNLGPDEEIVEIVLRDVFGGYTIIVLSNQRVRYCERTLILNNGKVNETFNRKSSLSQHSIATSEVFMSVPVRNVFETSF